MSPVNIRLEKGGKRFLREWIFRNLELTIEPGSKWAILGSNGSGKSTLLQSICGFQTLTEGQLHWESNNQAISRDDYRHFFSWSAPYIELPEELFAEEIIDHQKAFKPFTSNLKTEEVLKILYLEESQGKRIRYFSSGMKQRLKLGLAILADTPLLLLDEPVSNLDEKARLWFRNLLNEYASAKTIIVCSNNIQEEFDFAKQKLVIEDYKPAS
jgi:ABC-type multidrug transport system ATPase subunit